MKTVFPNSGMIPFEAANASMNCQECLEKGNLSCDTRGAALSQAWGCHPCQRGVLGEREWFYSRKFEFSSIFQYVFNPFPDFGFFVVVFQKLGDECKILEMKAGSASVEVCDKSYCCLAESEF